ncbi:MAG: BON domain-containing protein, partial [Desulfobacterales bacterium]|nr:BON domain-containing protein [Desulfobacterales bacterium]
IASLTAVMLACLVGIAAPLAAQDNQEAATGEEKTPFPAPKETAPQAPARVEVKPLARDHEIRERLEDILKATGWFTAPEARVNDGVVFLTGRTETAEFRKWAGDLARNTQDVAAVVNQIELIAPSIWDFQPAVEGLREQWRAAAYSFAVFRRRFLPSPSGSLGFLKLPRVFPCAAATSTRCCRISSRGASRWWFSWWACTSFSRWPD